MKCFRIIALLCLICIPAVHAQLCSGSLGDPVVKIDFGTGTASHGAALGTGITSYTYSSADFPNDGSYTIEKATNTAQTWWTTTDHTGGGYMMVVNASTSITDYFYKKTVTGLCPNTTYEFAAWFMNLLRQTDNSTPNITFTIESEAGDILATYNTGNIPLAGSAQWKQFGFFFDTPAGIDTVVIRMRNNKAGAAPGNDIALDDITFRACGPLVTTTVNNSSTTSLTVCENQVPQYTFGGSMTTGVYSSPAYQWQQSTDSGTTWTDIAGATTENLTVQPPQAAGIYMYRLSTAETSNITSVACRVASNVITITVKSGPVAPTVTTAPADCATANGSITITAPTGYTYSIDGTTYTSSVLFSGLTVGSYNVTAKDAATGCISPVTVAQVALGGVLPSAPAATAAAPATCATANGTITITDAAPQYSFDNGVTWVTSNIASLPPGNYSVEVKNASGCASAATAVTVPAASGFPPVPTLVVTQPNCTTTTGSITVTDTQAAYSFNNGVSWVTTNTLTNVAQGTYQILTKNALGCLSDPATAVITGYVNSEPLPVATDQTFCVYNNATVADIVVTGTNVKWYALPTGGSPLSATTLLHTATYYGTQTVSVCESLRVPISITVLTTPVPTGDAAQQFCTTQTPTVVLLTATGTALQWYDAATGGNILPATTILVNGTTYYATQTVSGCESQARLAVTVTIVTPTIPVNNVAHNACDDGNDGTETVDLTTYNPEITADAGSTFTYYTTAAGAANATAQALIANPLAYALHTGSNTIYVRIESLDKCHQQVTITLTLINEPVIAIADSLALCEGHNIHVNAGQGFDSYLWSTGAITEGITITAAGSYAVTVTKITGDVTCSKTKNFDVILSNIATIANVEVADWTESNNTVAVYVSAESVGIYEYSIDGINYQDSNVFTGLEPGVYTVYVRDTNGCGSTDKEVYILNYPKFFTPNADGSHDTWQVEFSQTEPTIETSIFDRYGKLITVLGYRQSWDGTFNGNPLPSTDYWFVVKRANGKIYKGHFSMVR